MDVRIAEDEFIVFADLPGMEEGNIDVQCRNGSLYITGDREFHHEDHENQFIQVERLYGPFEGRVTLPRGVDGSRLDAKYRQGVLQVTMPWQAS